MHECKIHGLMAAMWVVAKYICVGKHTYVYASTNMCMNLGDNNRWHYVVCTNTHVHKLVRFILTIIHDPYASHIHSYMGMHKFITGTSWAILKRYLQVAYIYMYICVYVYVYMYIYIYTCINAYMDYRNCIHNILWSVCRS